MGKGIPTVQMGKLRLRGVSWPMPLTWQDTFPQESSKFGEDATRALERSGGLEVDETKEREEENAETP